MKVIIAGGREFSDYELLKRKCNSLLRNIKEVTIISGTARGADQLGEQYAADMGHSLMRFPAKWDLYGKAAGYKRNEEMADNADILIAFWDGKSKGTEHMINIAKQKGLQFRVVNY